MQVERGTKESFVVIGKEGSTLDGEGFIERLWKDANSHFSEVEAFAKKDSSDGLVGIWGAMSDLSHSYQPWEDGFSKGLYLAGVECVDDAKEPKGWTRWTIPGYEYLRVMCDGTDVFSKMITYLADHQLTLAGAVNDYTDPSTGKSYMVFPIRRL